MTDDQDRKVTAARLRALAQQAEDEEQAAALLDTAAEHEALSLNGAASVRETA